MGREAPGRGIRRGSHGRFYAAAVGFHRFSGDPIILALPAAAFVAGAAGCLLSW